NQGALLADVQETPLGGDYWRAILAYALSVIDPALHSQENLVSLYKDILQKKQEDIMTIARQIELRGERRGELCGEQKGRREEKIALAKRMLADNEPLEKIKK
ncbi:MAG: hypothetical protein AAF734_07715, partial [Bacteroidota bacterium]